LASAASCRIDPAIGTQDPACESDEPTAPCKTLSRNLASCGDQPLPVGCVENAPFLQRFRAIIAATAIPNRNAIPDHSPLFSCTFDIVDAAALPAVITISNWIASTPEGFRIQAAGSDGAISD